MSDKNLYGTVAEFESPAALMKAAEALNKEGYTKFDAHSPFPIHGMDAAMGLGQSKLGWIVLGGGLTGLTLGILLQWWTSAVDYKMIISNKPLFSFQAFVPVTFELMILFSAFATVFGMFALNKLPMLYHAVFKASNFHKVTSDGFFISVEVADEKYNAKTTKALLESLGGKGIEDVEA